MNWLRNMTTGWLFSASMLLVAFATPGRAGGIGEFGFLPSIALVAPSILSEALDQYDRGLFRDPDCLEADNLSAALADSELPDAAGKPAFIVTVAQAKTLRIMTGPKSSTSNVEALDEVNAVTPSRGMLASPEGTSPDRPVDGAAMDLGSSGGDFTGLGGAVELYSAGLSPADIIGYSLTKPWLSTTALIASAGLVILIAIRRRTSTPPPAL
jgi:hypothetical protein